MKETELKQVNQEKDVGMIVDDQLKFENHMHETIRKASNMMRLIRRSLVHLDEEMCLKIQSSNSPTYRIYKFNMISYQNERYTLRPTYIKKIDNKEISQ